MPTISDDDERSLIMMAVNLGGRPPFTPSSCIQFISTRMTEITLELAVSRSAAANAKRNADPWDVDAAERDAIAHEPPSCFWWLRHPAVSREEV
jgi:hypothetical protein